MEPIWENIELEPQWFYGLVISVEYIYFGCCYFSCPKKKKNLDILILIIILILIEIIILKQA